MRNLMAEAMTERYVDYSKTHILEERGGKNIYYWVMSILEAFYWGHGRYGTFEAELYACELKMFLVFRHPTGKEYE